MQLIFLCIFAAAAVTHLASIFTQNNILQVVSKACLVPLILAVYLSGAEHIFVPVVMALVFGWMGDIFLVKIENLRSFRLGLASFLLGHICYIPSMLYLAGTLNRFVLIVSLVIVIPLGILLRSMVRPSREMNIPAIAYETIILLMAVSALQFFLARGVPSGALVFAGSLCFLASDSMLAFFTFRAKPRFGDFPVMFTYLAAQLCIVLGLSGV
jgi:uncharacterized membrane protein YhhN